MATPQRKTRRRNNQAQPQAQHQPQHQQRHNQQMTDYETDQQGDRPPTIKHIIDDINISVLRRYWPDIDNVLSVASFVELYVFIPEKQEWEKTGKAGSVFVCQVTSPDLGIERFRLVMLNRRGLDNFAAEIKSTHDIEITDELMINVKGGDGDGANIYGLWIHAEPDTSTARARELTAEAIMEVAERAEASRKSLLERMQDVEQEEEEEEEEQDNEYKIGDVKFEDERSSAPTGRQLSLSQLFQSQREQESGFNVHNHKSSRQQLTYLSDHRVQGTTTSNEEGNEHERELEELTPPTAPTEISAPQFQNHPDTDFFRSGPKFLPPVQEQSGQGAGHGVPVNSGNALLEDMFRRQRAGQ